MKSTQVIRGSWRIERSSPSGPENSHTISPIWSVVASVGNSESAATSPTVHEAARVGAATKIRLERPKVRMVKAASVASAADADCDVYPLVDKADCAIDGHDLQFRLRKSLHEADEGGR
jgi:hypothetical protein